MSVNIDLIFKNKINIFIFSVLFFSIGSFYIAFFPPDEPKYVDAALRMIETGNYIVPFFNCHVRFDKPILFYWELVAFFKLFSVDSLIKSGHDPLGIIEYSARLPAIMSGALTAVYVYMLSFELFKSKTVSKNSTIAFFSFFFFFYLTRAVYPDMSLILFELMAVYYFIKNRYCIAWIFVALAFLVKGPIGIVTPGFTYFLYLWIYKKRSGLKEFLSLKNGLGFLIFLLVSMPWYAAIYHLYGTEFINKFLIYHNIDRFTGAAHQHPHSFFYYIPIVLAAPYLWWPYLRDLIKKTDFKDNNNLFLLAWFVWVILFFSISRNKLVHYIAIAFIPLGIVFARYIESIDNSKLNTILTFVFEVVLTAGGSFYLYYQNLYYVIFVFLGCMVIVVTLNFIKKPINLIFYKTIVLGLSMFIVLAQMEPARAEKKIWRTTIKNPLPLYEYRLNNQSIVAYTRRCLRDIGNVNFFKNKRGTFYVYTKRKYLNDFINYKVVFLAIDRGKPTALIKISNIDKK